MQLVTRKSAVNHKSRTKTYNEKINRSIELSMDSGWFSRDNADIIFFRIFRRSYIWQQYDPESLHGDKIISPSMVQEQI